MAAGQRLKKFAQSVAAGQYGAIPPAAGGTPGAAPDPAMYGVFGPAYADTLKATANDDIRGPGDKYMLQVQSDLENKRYSEALKSSYLGQLGITQAKAKGDSNKELLSQIGNLGKYGIINSTHVGDDGSVSIDPVGAMVSDAYSLNERQAGIREHEAAAAKDRYDAGIATSPEQMANYDTPTNQTDRVQGYGIVNDANANYGDKTKRLDQEASAANGAVTAQAAMIRANKPNGGADGSPIISITAPSYPGQKPIITGRGRDPAAVQAAIDVASGGGGGNGTGLASRLAESISKGWAVNHQGGNIVLSKAGKANVVLDANGNVVK